MWGMEKKKKKKRKRKHGKKNLWGKPQYFTPRVLEY